jgi:hypothetical protein
MFAAHSAGAGYEEIVKFACESEGKQEREVGELSRRAADPSKPGVRSAPKSAFAMPAQFSRARR